MSVGESLRQSATICDSLRWFPDFNGNTFLRSLRLRPVLVTTVGRVGLSLTFPTLATLSITEKRIETEVADACLPKSGQMDIMNQSSYIHETQNFCQSPEKCRKVLNEC